MFHITLTVLPLHAPTHKLWAGWELNPDRLSMRLSLFRGFHVMLRRADSTL